MVKDVKTVCDAECDTDHRLVVSTITKKWAPSKDYTNQNDQSRKSRLNTDLLHDPVAKKQLCSNNTLKLNSIARK